MTNIRAIRGGDGPRAPDTIAEAIEQFAARAAALGPHCALMVLQRGDDPPEIFSYPPARGVKLGLLQELGDALVPSPFGGDGEE